jgi:hypothetical protein
MCWALESKYLIYSIVNKTIFLDNIYGEFLELGRVTKKKFGGRNLYRLQRLYS